MKLINPDLNREGILQAKLTTLRRSISTHVGQRKTTRNFTSRILVFETPLADVLEVLQWHLDRLDGIARRVEEDANESGAYIQSMNSSVELRTISWNEVLEVSKRHKAMLNRMFPKFKELPIELRLQIWDLAFEEDMQPRIQKLRILASSDGVDHRRDDNRDIEFVSNQPLNRILHVCREARAQYLFRTGATFAFKTLVKFDVDTIHLPLSLYDGLWSPDWETPFKKFTRNHGASLIRKLALPNDFMWMRNGDDWLCDPARLRTMLPLCEEVEFVFFERADGFDHFGEQRDGNARTRVDLEPFWKNTEGCLRRFSARESREAFIFSESSEPCQDVREMWS